MFLKVGDRAPALTADLNADVTGATVQLRVADLETGTHIFTRTMTVSDATNGIVAYQWVTPTDDLVIGVVGRYRMDVLVTFADGRTETFPQRSYLELVVKEAA